MATDTTQLREAAERWRSFSTNDYEDSDFSREDDAEILATYAAEQLAGDGGGLNWVGLDEAKQWPHGTQFVCRTKGSMKLCGAYECSFIRRWDSQFWTEPEKEFAALYTTPTT